MKTLLPLLLFLTSASAFAAPAWHHPLYLGNGGLWRQRIAIEVRNDMDQAVAGTPLAVQIGKGPGQADLAGALAQAVRVCDAKGLEMLFAISGPGGQLIKSGLIPEGGTLTIPVECPPKSAATYFAYFDNPDAWQVPDFLNVSPGLRNGGVEEGEGDAPLGWQHDGGDDQHRASWVTETPHSGKHCLKTVVAPGAEETWIATRQNGIPITGGARYVMTAWVKAQDVKGYAGWYIHVGNEQNYMITSPMLSGGAGTYDWKQLRAEFTAPKEATISDLGTVLRGTGTAWFDDVSLICLDEKAAPLHAAASKPERLNLQETGQDAPWIAGDQWCYRIPARVTNLTDEVQDQALVSVDLGGMTARLAGRVDPQQVQVADGTQPVKCYRVRDILLFECSTPPRTMKTYWIYFRQASSPVTPVAATQPAPGEKEYANPALPGGTNSPEAAATSLQDYAALLASPRNLVKNPSFELGDKLPDAWPGGAEGERPAGTEMGFDQPGLFGKRCAKMAVPPASRPAWTGWRQDVPVKPGKTYLYAAWLKGKDIKGGLQIHAHKLTATRELSKDNPYTGAGPATTGTTDWTLLSDTFTMPEDAAFFQLHLTMLATGTAWHDGVVLAEVTPGEAGRLQSRATGPTAGLTVWPVNAVVKVFHDDLPPIQVSSARITCAGNEHEPLQLAVRGPQALKGVEVQVDPPTSASGAKLADVQIGVVGYVPVDHTTNYYSTTSSAWVRKFPTSPGACDGWPGMWPDPILPRARFDLAPDQTQPVWITVGASKGAQPGDYTARVRFVSGAETLKELPFTVHVWRFDLPDERHVGAIYDTRQGGDIWSIPGKTATQVRDGFLQFMSERRVNPDSIRPDPVIRYENGQVVTDFTAYDKAAERYFGELHFTHTYTPGCFYLLQWGFPPPERFGEQPYEGKYPYEGVDRSKLRPRFKQVYQACLRAYWEHMKEKGWEKYVVLYIGDEPDISKPEIREQGKALLQMIREVDPKIAIYSSTWSHVPDWDGLLNLWGIGHFGIVPVEKIKERLAAGDRIRYTTDGQMCTDTPYCGVERLLPHYCFKYGAEAYEFWGIDWLTYDPYEFGWHSYIAQSDTPGKSYYVRYPNGDGFLAYPGKPIGYPGPVTSVRLEQAREGCEDCEYLYLLRDLVAKAKAAGKDATVGEKALELENKLVDIPNAGGRFSTNILPHPEDVLALKEAAAQAIEALRQ